MSDFASYVDRARRASGNVAMVADALQKAPDDRGLRISLVSARQISERADADASDAARDRHIDLVRYRLVERTRGDFYVGDVTKSLWSFQDLLSHTFVAIESGQPRKRGGHLPADTKAKTALSFGWTYAGSLGVVLLAPSEHTLFDGRFDQTVTAVTSLIEAKNEGEIREIGKPFGPAIVQKAFEWAAANAYADFDLDLQWRSSQDRMMGGLISRTTFERFIGAATFTKDVETRPFSTRGMLVGISSANRSFHLVEPDGDSYRGKFHESFPAQAEWAINHFYEADLIEETTLEYATGVEKRDYVLKVLRSN